MTACACCGGDATVFAVLDSARSCEDRPVSVFPPSGAMVTYHRCTRCRFIFCRDFDALSDGQMAERIYNADYILADPGFADARPRHFAAMLADLLPPGIAALDFGGGRGLLAARMREAGFADYESYDPYFDTAEPSAAQYDVITAFEVMEHSRDPVATCRAACARLKPGGVLLFSTMLQPRGVDADWWYIAPRNGHLSIHSDASLRRLARTMRMRCLSFDDGLHVMYASAAAPLARAIIGDRTGSILWHASRRGAASLASAASALLRLGFVLPALDPRHPVRMMMRGMRSA